jgi:NACHT domain
MQDFHGVPQNQNGVDLNYGGFIYNIEDLKISVAGLNSSEIESHRKDDHRGLISENQAQSLMDKWHEERLNSWIKIIALHHNPAPTTPENVNKGISYLGKLEQDGKLNGDDVQRFASDAVGFEGSQFLKRIAEDCKVQLILHGHHHASDQQAWTWHGQQSGMTHIMSAGSLGLIPNDLPQNQPNNLQLILLNPEKKELNSWILVYDPRVRTEGTVALGNFTSDPANPDGYQQTLSMPIDTQLSELPQLRESNGNPMDAVAKVTLDSQFKSEDEIDYENYLRSLKTKLNNYIGSPLPRFLDPKISVSTFDLHLKKDRPNVENIESEELLLMERSAIILGEPGSGKTYLLRYLALKLTENIANVKKGVIPIIIEGKQWGHPYSKIIDCICEELKLYVEGITTNTIKSELSKNRLIILVDGYDEIEKNSRNIFRRELEPFIVNYNAKIIITSRDANYHGELSPLFDVWSIEPLSIEQIDEFGKEVTSISLLSYRLRKQNLLELARLPLYLSMICQLINRNKEIPNNIALLHNSFAEYLLSEYPQQKDPTFESCIQLKAKLDFLSELSKERFKDSSFVGYRQCIKEEEWIDKKDLLFSEILESGLLVGDPSKHMDFIHPTIAEFFYARSISLLTSDQILAFAKENVKNEEMIEIFGFLIGLLSDQKKQTPLLDYFIAIPRCLHRGAPPSFDLTSLNNLKFIFFPRLDREDPKIISI